MAAFKTNFPLREHNPKSKYIKREPWYTTGLLTSSKQKSKLLTKKLCKPTEANVKEFKEYNNIYNKLKRRMKATFYKIKLDENRQNIKKTWSILKQALGKCNDKSNYPNIFKINNDTVTDRYKAAKGFNDFFSNVGHQTSHNVPKTDKSFSSFMPPPLPDSMFIEPVTPTEVLNIANKLKSKSSYGHDNISSKLLKETILYIIKPITHIINISFDTKGC